MGRGFKNILTGIFFIALATLTYEVALSYVFAYIFWFDTSIAILSTAMFGLGIGGVLGYFITKRKPNRYYEALQYSSFISGVMLFLSFYLITKGSQIKISTLFSPTTRSVFQRLGLNLIEVFPLIYFSLSASLPFIFAGIVLSMGLNYPSEDKRVISYIYFSSLVGAGIGSFSITGLLSLYTIEEIMIISSVLILLSSLSFQEKIKSKQTILPAVTVLLVILIFSSFPASFSPEVSEYKHLAKQKEKGAEIIASKWDPVSRIDAISKDNRVWLVENGVTPVEVSRGDTKASYLREDPRYLMFEIHDPAPQNMLAIGSGGGIELTMALNASVKNIKALEINPQVVKYMTNDFAEFSNRLYYNPAIETIIEDGRTYVHRSTEKFDLIENGVVGGAGLVVPSSRMLNFMYVYVFTEEANIDYWNHLNEDGVIHTIIYVLLDEHNTVDADRGVSYHLLRQYNTVKAALEKEGVDPGKHMMIFQFHPDGGPRKDAYQGEYTFIFKRELTRERVNDLIERARKYELKPAYAPYYSSSIDLEKYSQEIPKERSVSSATDDKPFFYHTERAAPQVLNQLILIFGVLTFLFMILPIMVEKRFHLQHTSNYFLLLYFLCLGVGFMLIEVVLIQKLTLFLGRPAYAFQIVLFSILIFSGIGSFLTGSLQDTKLSKTTPIIVFTTFLLVLGYVFLTPRMIEGYMHHTIIPKIVLSIAFIAPLALIMGMPFPTGLRITSLFSKDDVVWMFALNGSGSVLGSLVGMLIAFNHGYSYSLLVGGIVYLLAFLSIFLTIKFSKYP
ncbi:MAG: hypothetical protein ACE5J5_03190 [Candidatus Hydrothermarchaeales archaeon]